MPELPEEILRELRKLNSEMEGIKDRLTRLEKDRGIEEKPEKSYQPFLNEQPVEKPKHTLSDFIKKSDGPAETATEAEKDAAEKPAAEIKEPEPAKAAAAKILCPACGHNLSPGSLFCDSCGIEFSEYRKRVTGKVLSADSSHEEKTEPTRKKPAELLNKAVGGFRKPIPEQITDSEPEEKSIKKMEPAQKASLSEAEIGMKWFGLAGISLVVFAFAFFVKFAIDNEWIGPTTRIIGGVTLGLALIGLGKWFNTKEQYQGYDRTLIGGGFSLLYFTIYAAYHFYGDFIGISREVDLVLLTLVVGGAIAFAIVLDSIVLAGEAFLLGYATAYLCGTITQHTLFYNIVLAGGLIFLVRKKGWLSIGSAGLVATYVFHFIWLNANPDKTLANLLFLVTYFVLFVSLGFAEKFFLAETNKELKLKRTELPAQSLYVIYTIAALSMILPIVSTALSTSSDSSMLMYYVAMSAAVLALSFIYSLSGAGVMAIAANYTAFIVWNENARAETSGSLAFLIVIYVMFAVYAFLMQGLRKKSPFEEISIVLINSFCFFGFLFTKIYSDYHEYAGLFTLAMAIVSLGQCALASQRKHNTLFQTYLVLTVVFVTLAVPVQLTKHWLPVSWAAEAVALLYLSFVIDNPVLRKLSKVVAAISLISVLAYLSHSSLRIMSLLVTSVSFFASAAILHIYAPDKKKQWHDITGPTVYSLIGSGLFMLLLYHSIENTSLLTIAFCVWGLGLLLVAKFLRIKWLAVPAFFVHAVSLVAAFLLTEGDNLLAIGSLSSLILTYFVCYALLIEGDEAKTFRASALAYVVTATVLITILLTYLFNGTWLSIAWGVEAIVILVIGVVVKSKHVRYAGIGLLGLTLAKVVVVDMASLDMAYRVISLFGIGLVFLLASFLYYKYRERIEEFL